MWHLLNGITLVLITAVMLLFLVEFPSDKQWLPLFFSGLFFVFYAVLHRHLLGNRWTLGLLTWAFGLSFFYDIWLVHQGWYSYGAGFFNLANMPIAALLTWCAAIGQAYHFNTAFLYFLNQRKPKKRDFKKLGLLIFFDGLHLLTFGAAMEYFIIKSGFGTWHFKHTAHEFGLPWGAVLSSYFLVGAVGSGGFRVVEFLRQRENIPSFVGYETIFGTVYLIAFFVNIAVLIQTDFPPVFMFITATIALTWGYFKYLSLKKYDKRA
jgi:hypothetical protein